MRTRVGEVQRRSFLVDILYKWPLSVFTECHYLMTKYPTVVLCMKDCPRSLHGNQSRRGLNPHTALQAKHSKIMVTLSHKLRQQSKVKTTADVNRTKQSRITLVPFFASLIDDFPFWKKPLKEKICNQLFQILIKINFKWCAHFMLNTERKAGKVPAHSHYNPMLQHDCFLWPNL